MEKTEIIIIGAGATGLMAAYQLSRSGKKVAVIEARDRIGGRIHTLNNSSFSSEVELGAEFIHGNLPLTLQLLQEAGINYYPAAGEMWQASNGKLSRRSWDMPGWEDLMTALFELKEDISIAAFLENNFGASQYAQLRASVIGFIAGYDTADPARASTFALRSEWQQDDEEDQYRISGGYRQMIAYLERQCKANGVEFLLNTPAKHIDWINAGVKVTVQSGDLFLSDRVVIAVPLGVLKAEKGQSASLLFEPPIAEYQKAIQQMGFGGIIKLLLEFKTPFWENGDAEKIGFILSDEAIPTWWTQYPVASNILTGWLGGLPAEAKKELNELELLELALQSLANIFNRNLNELRDALIAFKAVNWTTDPFTLGSYAYDTVESIDARNVLRQAIAGKIFFAGEYLYEGPAMGTVEAALFSGNAVAEQIINLL